MDELGGTAGPSPDPPPRKRKLFARGTADSGGAKRPRATGGISDKDLKDSLRKFFREVAPPIAEFAGDEYDAKVLKINADRLADSYVALAKDSPRFRVLLEGILTAGGSFAGAFFATAAVSLPILHHHRVISLPPFMGFPLLGEALEIHPDKPEENGRGKQNVAPPDASGFTADAVV